MIHEIAGPLVLGFVASLWSISPALSADVAHDTADEITECDYMLSGEIVPGDLDRLTENGIFEAALERDWFDNDFVTLCLDSPGGSFAEGLQIARRLDGSNITTVLRANAECYSACAVAFMGGSTFMEGTWGSRKMHWTANLGFHAPYIDLTGKEFSEQDIVSAYETGLRSVAEMMRLGAMAHPGAQGFIPSRIILELLERGPSEFFMIDSPVLAKELDIEVFGVTVPDRTIEGLCNACIVANDGHVRYDLCERASVGFRGPDSTEISFHGVAAEGHAFCVTRLSSGPGANGKAEITRFPVGYYTPPLDDSDFMELNPVWTLPSLGHD